MLDRVAKSEFRDARVLASFPPQALAVGALDLGELLKGREKLNPDLRRISLSQVHISTAARWTELHPRHQP